MNNNIDYYKSKLKDFLRDHNIECDDIIIVNPRDISISNDFPTFKDLFGYFMAPFGDIELSPGRSIGPFNISPILNGAGDNIGWIYYGVSKLQYHYDTIRIDLASYVGKARLDDKTTHNEIASLYFRMNLDTKELIDMEVVRYTGGASYKYPLSTYINDPLVKSREDVSFIHAMDELEKILKSNEN